MKLQGNLGRQTCKAADAVGEVRSGMAESCEAARSAAISGTSSVAAETLANGGPQNTGTAGCEEEAAEV